MKTIDINLLLLQDSQDTVSKKVDSHYKLKNTFIEFLKVNKSCLFANSSFLKTKNGFVVYIDRNRLEILVCFEMEFYRYKVDFNKSFITVNDSRFIDQNIDLLIKQCRQIIDFSTKNELLIAKSGEDSFFNNRI